MSYPKYLSEKTLKKRYEESGLSEEKIDFLKTFCKASANLYGVIAAQDAWDQYRLLSDRVSLPVLHKRELLTALKIFRREDLPFYVFEQNEVFTLEPQIDRYMFIISKDLVGYGYGRFFDVYNVMEICADIWYFLPDNFLDYAERKKDPREEELLQTLNGLKCTESEYEHP